MIHANCKICIISKYVEKCHSSYCAKDMEFIKGVEKIGDMAGSWMQNLMHYFSFSSTSGAHTMI
jgi:hypothetical protein